MNPNEAFELLKKGFYLNSPSRYSTLISLTDGIWFYDLNNKLSNDFDIIGLEILLDKKTEEIKDLKFWSKNDFFGWHFNDWKVIDDDRPNCTEIQIKELIRPYIRR